jgi:precorrin-8X/cobalt-precorrin-8 methylmutase
VADLSTRRAVHPIERESYAIMRRRVRTEHLPPLTRAVVERVVHASADPAYVDDLVCDEAALASGLCALRAGAALVVDAHMVGAGITSRESVCLARDPRAAGLAAASGLTRSAAAVRLAASVIGPGAVWVVGNAPTALVEVIDLAGSLRPALVVGLPVGFVGAVASKQALREAGLPCLSNRSEKGGSAVAAAAVNALLYLEDGAR